MSFLPSVPPCVYPGLMTLNSCLLGGRPCPPQEHNTLQVQVVTQRRAAAFGPALSFAVANFNN